MALKEFMTLLLHWSCNASSVPSGSIRLPLSWVSEYKKNTWSSRNTAAPKCRVNPITEFLLCKEFLKSASLCEVSVIILWMIKSFGFNVKSR